MGVTKKKTALKCSQDIQKGLLKLKKKCSQESKRNRSKNIKSEEEKLVCKGNFETWTEFFDISTIFKCVTKKKTNSLKIFDKWTLKIGKIETSLNRDFLLKRMNISSQIFVTSGTKQKYLD